MSKTIDDFTGFGVDDIITLSDLQTQEEYNKTSVDFRIREVRVYKEPQGVFTYTAYLAEYKPNKDKVDQIMLLVMQVGSEFELRVYFLDNDGASDDFAPVFAEDKDDLIDRFDVTLNIGDEEYPVTWDKQGSSAFGVETTSTESNSDEPDCKTLAEYFTNDETKGNPHCFIEWTGDKEGGYIEIWYGCEIRNEDVEIYSTNSDE